MADQAQVQKSFKSDPNHDQVGKLYLVPTPIGNLQDMTFRAVDTLKVVDLIAAEDTRHTQKLLNHFEIDTKKISFHEHNTQERIPELIEKLLQGQSIAQVSDAGMPSISDPGKELVAAAIDHDISVVALPGANAALTALIASGLSPQPFYFHGFLPRSKKDQEQELQALANKTESLIFYESPHRLKQVIKQMSQIFDSDRQVVLARELTKEYEEFVRGKLKTILNWLEEGTIRGEFVIIVEGNSNPSTDTNDNQWLALSEKDHVERAMTEEGFSSKEAIKHVAKLRDVPKRQIYAAYHELDQES